MIISSDELQSKAQFNLQSLGESKTSYHAENIHSFFHRWKLQEKSTFVYIRFLYPPDNVMYCYSKQC